MNWMRKLERVGKAHTLKHVRHQMLDKEKTEKEVARLNKVYEGYVVEFHARNTLDGMMYYGCGIALKALVDVQRTQCGLTEIHSEVIAVEVFMNSGSEPHWCHRIRPETIKNRKQLVTTEELLTHFDARVRAVGLRRNSG